MSSLNILYNYSNMYLNHDCFHQEKPFVQYFSILKGIDAIFVSSLKFNLKLVIFVIKLNLVKFMYSFFLIQKLYNISSFIFLSES